ncbi:MAG: pyruvate kinase [Kocuria rhizophila]|uniref:pyruvate kinase n=1 Tax=Kocuria carniphila TaxID=262208 RepID=UPI000DB596C5|nr:pyruvate kinase [Kocuria carniphila]PZP37411.1 MAG: pyruvate kinase [Kocuria rhizophila]
MSQVPDHVFQQRRELASQAMDTVEELFRVVRAARSAQLDRINRVLPRHRWSAVNLVDYAAVRSQDVRQLQSDLSDLGLSSLGRMKAGVEDHLKAVLLSLAAVAERPEPNLDMLDVGIEPGEGHGSGQDILERNAVQLLGRSPEDRETRIMVTLPSEAAADAALVRDMVAAGMNVARVNCAHDGPEEWARMIDHVRTAASDLGKDLRVSMDLGGPKVRTGPIEPGPRVEKIKPERDATGHVTERARLWLGTSPHDDLIPSVPVSPATWLSERTVGERIRLRDARDSGRSLRVMAVEDGGVLMEFAKTVYFATDLVLKAGNGDEATLGELPETEQALRLNIGDTLRLVRSLEPVPAVTQSPFTIGCTLPEAFQDAAPGDRVWLDDGKIGGVVRTVTPDSMDIEVLHTGPNGSNLKAEKGINFPDTDLQIRSLTPQDRKDLEFVARHADIVNMSFVRSRTDVTDLLDELTRLKATEVDVTLKIETVGGFEQLPQMLLEVMRWKDAGVMIARGDLAVETGFERLAEVQQEILWLCEAAHVPVIWATQVLESLAKKGIPSRAEVTDAAEGQRAECVMLNKGPFIIETIEALASILGRMSGHVIKKTDLLRKLHAWREFVSA